MAEIYDTAAIILRIKALQATDKLYICYSRELGKIAVIAYGIGRGKNRYNGIMRPFGNVKLSLASSRQYEIFKQVELLGPITDNADVDFLAYASVLTEITELLTPDRDPEPAIYELLARCLELLGERNKRLVTVIFIVQLLDIIGMGPDYRHCSVCSTTLEDAAYFDDLKEGMVCSGCHVTEDFLLDFPTQNLLEKFTKLDLSNKIQFSVTGGQLKQLEALAYKLIHLHVDRPLKSLQFLAGIS